MLVFLRKTISNVLGNKRQEGTCKIGFTQPEVKRCTFFPVACLPLPLPLPSCLSFSVPASYFKDLVPVGLPPWSRRLIPMGEHLQSGTCARLPHTGLGKTCRQGPLCPRAAGRAFLGLAPISYRSSFCRPSRRLWHSPAFGRSLLLAQPGPTHCGHGSILQVSI